MSTFRVQKVEFEPPIKGEPVKPFAGWLCVGRCDESSMWFSGCDVDSPADAYRELCESCDPVAATVQMFRVDPA